MLKYTYIGDFQFSVGNIIELGTTKNVTTRFLTHQTIEQYLKIGQKWWMHERPQKIGEAEMIEIKLPKDK